MNCLFPVMVRINWVDRGKYFLNFIFEKMCVLYCICNDWESEGWKNVIELRFILSRILLGSDYR